MFEGIRNVEIVATFHKVGDPFKKVENRKHHFFAIRRSGSVRYEYEEGSLCSEAGSLVYLPKGLSYTATALTETHSFTSIHFEADFSAPLSPALFSLENFMDADYMGERFADLWNFGGEAEKYQCLSLFYSLLSHLAAEESKALSPSGKSRLIDPAMEYLKEHLYDCNLKTEKLYRLCGISGTYFRRIFFARFGTTPQNYICTKRLSHAKTMLDSGDFLSIGEVSQAVGFSDPLYFSKAFKKAFGLSPTEEILKEH